MMKAYPVYKDSGLPWLGQVPNHWEVIRNKFVFREVEERSKSGHETLLSLTRSRGLIPQAEHTSKESSADSLEGYRLCRPGQIVMNRMQAWSGMFDAARLSGLVSPDYTVLAPKVEVNTEFAAHWFRSPRAVCEFRKKSRGIGSGFFRLYTPDFGDVAIALPPRDEQDAIVAFLEGKQREMDAFIANKQRTSALLEEQLITTIESHLTRHDDKPSVKLGYFVELVSGFPFASSGFTANDSDIRLLRGVNVSPGELRWIDVVRWPQAEAHKFSHYELRVGDLVLGMDRPWISTGIRVASIQEKDVPALLLQRVVRLRARPELRQGYLRLILSSRAFLAYFEPILTGISVPHISPEQVGNFRSQIPSLEVQDKVLESVAAERSRVDEAVTQAHREITLMQEYRAALITEAVTGRIDVRSQPSDRLAALAGTVAGGSYASDYAGTSMGETPPQTSFVS